MNYGTYSPKVKDVYVEKPLNLVLNASLKKRVRSSVNSEISNVYKNWVGFLKRKTLLDEYMIYTSLLAERAVEFDTYDRLHEFCEEYSKFRIILKKGRLYVNWLELYDEFKKDVKEAKRPFWKRLFGIS